MKNKISFIDFLSENKSKTFLILYWVFVFIFMTIVNTYSLRSSSFLIAIAAYVPYRMLVYNDKNLKQNIKKTIFTVILFSGILNIYSLAVENHIESFIKSPEMFTKKIISDKVISLDNLNIYINEKDRKVYIYYKVNGFFGTKYTEIDNLVESKDSEYSLRYGDFHKLNENVEIAFPTYKNEFSTEYLFKVKNEGKQYIFKSFVPFENCLSLIKKAEFKQTLNINLSNDEKQSVYINPSSKELIISDGKVAVSSKYIEVPYDKEDYFTYRYEMFQNNVNDDSKITKNLEVTLLNTYSDISTDITRVTFYSEGTEQSIMYGVGEIIFDKFAYVFRTGIIDVDSIISITRPQ